MPDREGESKYRPIAARERGKYYNRASFIRRYQNSNLKQNETDPLPWIGIVHTSVFTNTKSDLGARH